ncbi:MAG TPA: PIN domain-containing protein [Thermoanaerobaculia bacterium]|jgi:predicted nucleic acid-binding protein|nr:PIN domain-containing protein [Thermoanaerobaculia bacterium]
MVLVDTSIWIALFRKRDSQIAEKIWMLAACNEAAVAGPIWVEFLGGFRQHSVRKAYEHKFRAYPFLETTRDAWDLAADFLAAHPRLGAGDAIIAAIAITSDAELWTIDNDFEVLIDSGLRLFR